MKPILWSAPLALLLALAAVPGEVRAETQSAAVTVNAQIGTGLSLTVVLNRVDPANNNAETPMASMNFGEMKPNVFGGMDAPYYFKAYINANSQSKPYTLTQNGSPVSNGSTALPQGACKVTPTYNAGDNGGASSVGTLGSTGTWVGNRTLYTSDTAGSMRTVTVYYGLIGDPAAGAGNFIPSNQASGSYSGTITFTVTT